MNTAMNTSTTPATVASSHAQGPPAYDHQASDTVVAEETVCTDTSAPAVTPTMTSPASPVKVTPTQFSAASLTHIIGDQSFLSSETDEAFLIRHSLSLRTPQHG